MIIFKGWIRLWASIQRRIGILYADSEAYSANGSDVDACAARLACRIVKNHAVTPFPVPQWM